MEVTVIGRKVTVTDALNDYAVEKIGNAMKVLSIDIPKAEVVLRVEKNRAVPCICEVTIRPKGHTIHVEEHEEDMYAAIDVAAAKVLRQLRKYKTRVIDYRMRETLKVDQVIEPTGASLDELMAELSADDEVVRVKEIDLIVFDMLADCRLPAIGMRAADWPLCVGTVTARIRQRLSGLFFARTKQESSTERRRVCRFMNSRSTATE